MTLVQGAGSSYTGTPVASCQEYVDAYSVGGIERQMSIPTRLRQRIRSNEIAGLRVDRTYMSMLWHWEARPASRRAFMRLPASTRAPSSPASGAVDDSIGMAAFRHFRVQCEMRKTDLQVPVTLCL